MIYYLFLGILSTLIFTKYCYMECIFSKNKAIKVLSRFDILIVRN
jgi:hypothetical protein